MRSFWISQPVALEFGPVAGKKGEELKNPNDNLL